MKDFPLSGPSRPIVEHLCARLSFLWEARRTILHFGSLVSPLPSEYQEANRGRKGDGRGRGGVATSRATLGPAKQY